MKKTLPVLITIFIYLVLIITLGHYKEYLYEDEVLSYTSANSQSGMYIKIDPGKWYDSSLVTNAITAVPGHTFDYANTIRNSFSDNHPPLFTMLIHTVSSFFPGSFSKWYGFSVNIASGILIIILLYLLSLEIFRGRILPSFAVILSFALSIGFTDTVLFIRNYTLFMMFGILSMLLHVHYIKKEKEPFIFYLFLFITSVSGMMSHYYFLTVLFYIASFFCLYLLIHKRFQDFIFYCITMVFSAGSVLLLLPDIISDIFTSESGSGSFKRHTAGELINRFQQTYIIINKAFWGGAFKFFALAVIIYIIYRIIRKQRFNFSGNIPVLTVLWTVCLFYAVASCSLTYIGSRYLSPIYPFIMLLIVFAADKIIDLLFKNPAVGMSIFIFIFMLPMLDRFSGGMTDTNKIAINAAASSHSDDYCIYDCSIPIEENFFELEKYRGIFASLSDYSINDDKIRNASELVVYVPDGSDPEKTFENIRKCNPQLTVSERLYVAYYSTAYLLSK